jgi:hypothetical protein
MGTLARLSNAADAHTRAHKINLLKQLVGKKCVPMNRLMFLMQHPVYGWIVYLRILYLALGEPRL